MHRPTTTQYYSLEQLSEPPKTRTCIGAGGVLWLCEHHAVTFRELRKMRAVFLSLDGIHHGRYKFCNHMDHVDSYPPFWDGTRPFVSSRGDWRRFSDFFPFQYIHLSPKKWRRSGERERHLDEIFLTCAYQVWNRRNCERVSVDVVRRALAETCFQLCPHTRSDDAMISANLQLHEDYYTGFFKLHLREETWEKTGCACKAEHCKTKIVFIKERRTSPGDSDQSNDVFLCVRRELGSLRDPTNPRPNHDTFGEACAASKSSWMD